MGIINNKQINTSTEMDINNLSEEKEGIFRNFNAVKIKIQDKEEIHKIARFLTVNKLFILKNFEDGFKILHDNYLSLFSDDKIGIESIVILLIINSDVCILKNRIKNYINNKELMKKLIEDERFLEYFDDQDIVFKLWLFEQCMNKVSIKKLTNMCKSDVYYNYLLKKICNVNYNKSFIEYVKNSINVGKNINTLIIKLEILMDVNETENISIEYSTKYDLNLYYKILHHYNCKLSNDNIKYIINTRSYGVKYNFKITNDTLSAILSSMPRRVKASKTEILNIIENMCERISVTNYNKMLDITSKKDHNVIKMMSGVVSSNEGVITNDDINNYFYEQKQNINERGTYMILKKLQAKKIFKSKKYTLNIPKYEINDEINNKIKENFKDINEFKKYINDKNLLIGNYFIVDNFLSTIIEKCISKVICIDDIKICYE